MPRAHRTFPARTHVRRVLRGCRHAAEIAAVCVWALAFLIGVQGWMPVGAEWYSASGASAWSRCGSAMCACPIEQKTPFQRRAAADLPGHRSCCDDEEASPEQRHAGAGPSSHGVLRFVALGSDRHEQTRGSSMPESLVLTVPPLRDRVIDLVLAAGSAENRAATRRMVRALEVPAPPPRA
ncbi:MAG: hypothetical protein IPJ41_02430 [Phycisphaerales bacterium]|nr:hypothetical protein [Phycisphaerales bacterium]